MEKAKIKYWGWGSLDNRFDLTSRPFFWDYLTQKIVVPQSPSYTPPDINDLDISPSLLSDKHFKQLQEIVGKSFVSKEKSDRLSNSFGKSFYDLIRFRTNQFEHITDAVIFPRDDKQIEKILHWAVETKCSVVPFGGGTSVVGGVEPVKDSTQNSVITLNLKHFNKVLEIDSKSMLVDVQAGILGPALEKSLQKQDLTLAHYPESFEFSTLGGWIATRSAGQQSTLYGKIEDMVESLTMVTANGIIETPNYPAAANGPDQKQTLIGSEGILGVITSARIRVKKIPPEKSYRAFFVDSFANGIELCRSIIQSGIKPATIRFSDEEESGFILSLRKKSDSSLKNKAQEYALKVAEKKGLKPDKRTFLLIGFEGSKRDVAYNWKKVKSIISGYRTFSLGEMTGQSWYKHRFEIPYLRDELMDYNLLVDTLETSTEWSNLENLYSSVKTAIQKTFDDLGIRGVVTAHLSHLYASGCSLYFIILASPKTNEIIHSWQKIKQVASDTIIEAHGSISHHHGVGRDHRKWLRQDVGDFAVNMLRKIKATIDPDNILNPGKLLPEPPLSENPFIRKMSKPGQSIEFSANTREDYIRKLQSEQFDILVIGGGITGAGVVRDAALRGYKTALIEKDDFASGTSSKSSKLVHGGFRYLKNLEFGLVHEALMERKNLMDIAPHLVHPIQCLFPVYKDSSVPGWMIQLGMLLYDGLSFTKRIGLHKLIPLGKNDKPEPGLLKKGLEKLFMYYDSRADDTRLVMATIQSAVQSSAITANYVKAIDVLNENDKVVGIRARDEISGNEFEIRAHVVANATGPWSDPVRQALLKDNKQRLRTTKGIHIIVRAEDLAIKRTMILSTIQDKRPVFAIPWRKFVILGTTDTYFDGDPDWVDIGDDDVDYLLETYNHYFPKGNLTKQNVISAYSGLRPLTFEEGKSAGQVTREYQIFEGPDSFFNIIGGKLTTYRTMAQELVDRLGNALDESLGILAQNSKCTTDKTALYGGDIENYEQFESEWTSQLTGQFKFDEDVAQNLIESYGSKVPDVLTILDKVERGREKIINDLPYLWGEIDYCCSHEMAMALDDFLMRRTHLFSLDPKQAMDVHVKVAERMSDILGWSENEKEDQLKRYKTKVEMVQAFK